MVLTFEDYHKLNPTQRTKVKRADLQQLLDEHINADNANSIRGIIREELKTIAAGVEKKITEKYDKKIQDVEEENERLKKENSEIKAAISEQQKFLERIRGEKNATNIFISGIPNEMDVNDVIVNNPSTIVNHILKFLKPNIEPDDYKILKNFEPREGNDRHSAKISCSSLDIKKDIFLGCSKFKDLPTGSPLKKVFLKNEDTPLQRKENDRLFKKMRELRDAEEDPDNPTNVYKIRSGKLFKNEEVVDTFNLENQLFA